MSKSKFEGDDLLGSVNLGSMMEGINNKPSAFFSNSKPRSTVFGKDRNGLIIKPGDLLTTKGKVFEVEDIFLDDSYGEPIVAYNLNSSLNRFFVFNTKTLDVYLYSIERKDGSNYPYIMENYLTLVDNSWIPPYLDVAIGGHQFGQIGRTSRLKPLLSDGFEVLCFQSNRIRGTSLENNDRSKSNFRQDFISVYGKSITRESYLEARSNLNPMLLGDKFLHSEYKR